MIIMSHAISDPGTVMIHLEHTLSAQRAVMRSWWLDLFTFFAISVDQKVSKRNIYASLFIIYVWSKISLYWFWYIILSQLRWRLIWRLIQWHGVIQLMWFLIILLDFNSLWNIIQFNISLFFSNTYLCVIVQGLPFTFEVVITCCLLHDALLNQIIFRHYFEDVHHGILGTDFLWFNLVLLIEFSDHLFGNTSRIAAKYLCQGAKNQNGERHKEDALDIRF